MLRLTLHLAKFNVNAVVSRDGGKGVAAAICRDGLGNYLGASALVMSGISDPAIIETIACREDLALPKDLSLSDSFVASDCKVAMENISKVAFGCLY
jgi:hypothetical protein